MNSTVFNKKNRYILIILAVLLLIPGVLAVYFSTKTDPDSVTPHRILSLAVSKEVLSFTGFTFDQKADFDVYVTAIENARLIDENYRDLSEEIPYTVTFTETDNITKNYSFYMQNDVDGCIYTDADGKYYLLSASDASTLLARDEFGAVNVNANVPVAVITKENGNTTTVYASGGTWNYLNADGAYESQSVSNPDEMPSFAISLSSLGTLSFTGDKAPDHVTVSLSANGVVRHEGAYENMLSGAVMSENDTYYDLVINAEWANPEGEKVPFFGNIVYTAKVLYDVDPSYSIIYRGVVSKGDFTILKIKNFNEGDKLYASSDYPFPKELKVFHSDAGYDFAFLPAEYSDTASATYDLKLSLEDGSSQTLKVTVRDGRVPTVKSQDLLVNDESLQAAFTADAITEIENIIAEKTAVSHASPLWDGKFVYPNAANTANIGTGMAGFGTKRAVRALHQAEYVHNGIDIAMEEGADVLAANNGKVVFAGDLTLTGGTVIIDHGCSIFSYYYHLSSVSVSEGDTVSKSGVIGKAGSTGFAATADGAVYKKAPQVHFATEVDGVFVNPYYLQRSGVDFND